MSARGSVTVDLDGKKYALALTLGALADIEDGLGIDDLGQLQERLEKPRGRDIVVLLTALLRGGGSDADEDFVRSLPLTSSIMTDIVEAISAGFGDQDENPTKPTARKKSPGVVGKK